MLLQFHLIWILLSATCFTNFSLCVCGRAYLLFQAHLFKEGAYLETEYVEQPSLQDVINAYRKVSAYVCICICVYVCVLMHTKK